MSQRVIIGKRADINQTGMWISAPGKDATSANWDDLLVDTTRFNAQYVQKGMIINPTLPLISDTHSTGSTYVCDVWNGYWYPSDTAWPRVFVATSCQSGHNEQVANNGVATYQQSYYHGLGYRPLGLFSVQADQPATPVPQMVLDNNYIHLRYDEAANGYVAGDHIAYWGTTPSSYTFNSRIYYTLFNRSF